MLPQKEVKQFFICAGIEWSISIIFSEKKQCEQLCIACYFCVPKNMSLCVYV